MQFGTTAEFARRTDFIIEDKVAAYYKDVMRCSGDRDTQQSSTFDHCEGPGSQN
jgi:hypothetical protein